MAPGQVHYVFTLSKEAHGELSIGALMQGSFFLSPQCMTRSLHSSWVDHHLQSQGVNATHGCDTVSTMLSAYVSGSHRHLISNNSLIGNPPPKEVFSAMFMALMFPTAVKDQSVVLRAQSIIRHYVKLYEWEYEEFRLEFNRVKAANLSDDTFNDQEVAELRGSMKAAVQNMASL